MADSAPPARPVEAAAHEHIADFICDAVAKGGYDGMFLDLHGAMVTESFEDGEGELLRRIRAIDPTTPIAVSLDMHANLYDAIIDNATVVTGYRTYPHIDTYDTATRAGEILLKAMPGEIARPSSTRSSRSMRHWRAPRHCRRRAPVTGRWCCSIITTIAPRAARWTRRWCSRRSCGPNWTMSPPSRSTIPRRCKRR